MATVPQLLKNILVKYHHLAPKADIAELREVLKGEYCAG